MSDGKATAKQSAPALEGLEEQVADVADVAERVGKAVDVVEVAEGVVVQADEEANSAEVVVGLEVA
jgi:hypothetical protein